MQLIISNLRIPVEQDHMETWLHEARQALRIHEGVSLVKVLSKTLDLRDPEQFFYVLSLVVSLENPAARPPDFPVYTETPALPPQKRLLRERPIVVGFGPAGMFAALELLACGLKPLIFERGKKIEERSLDVQHFIDTRELNPESNIQFGEGGAGAYSDGKLFSRRDSNTRQVNRVLETFVRFGAPPEILYMGKPHLGTDVLCNIVRNMRNHILERGGEIHYEARMTDLLLSGDRVRGIVINEDRTFLSGDIYLALGHSSRDTFAMLHRKGVAMERRPISVGLRIEHPAEAINTMRYGDKYKNFPPLGAATYSLNHTHRPSRRGVYTFCMCPGGEVVNAASEQGGLVLNGMSYAARSSPFSNAALVVSCHVEDYESEHPLAGFAFQREIESRAFRAGNRSWAAPAQGLMHFLGKKGAVDLPVHSYRMGLVPADMHDIFPAFVLEQLHMAFEHWEKDIPAFVSHEALLLGAETRTSSPVRILRDDRCESLTVKGLYPIGEGSGHTGGITSSAADALRAVEKHALDLNRKTNGEPGNT